VIGPAADPQVILCRTNAEAFAQARAAMSAGRRAALAASSVRELKHVAQAALDLRAAGRTGYPQLAAFRSWGQVRDHARCDSTGSDLSAAVRLIDSHGVAMVLGVIDGLSRVESAEVVACTVHSAKGREWERVRIGGDFPQPRDGRAVPREEAMLAYVAVTRARSALDHAGLAWIDNHPVARPRRKENTMSRQPSSDLLVPSESPRPYAGGRAQAESGSRIIDTDYTAWTAVAGALPADHRAMVQLGQQWRSVRQRGLDDPGLAAGRYLLLAHAASVVAASDGVAERPLEAAALVQLASHAKLHAGRLSATADQQDARSEQAGPYASRGHAESGARIIENDYRKWSCTSAARQIVVPEHSLHVQASRLAEAMAAVRRDGLADGPGPAAARYGELADAAGAVTGGFTPELPCFALHLISELAGHAGKHAVRLHATAGAQDASGAGDRQVEAVAGQFEARAPQQGDKGKVDSMRAPVRRAGRSRDDRQR
jgi:hypothetical protein